jgi:hypothetical protein
MISPGEITVGMVLTVLEWEPIIREPDGIFTTTRTEVRDNSWKGDILDVEAVQLPFIVVRERGGCPTRGITLDTRRVTLMELTPEFIAAKEGKAKN